MAEYQSKLVQQLAKLYQEWNERLASGHNIGAYVYKILRPEIPNMLVGLDKDEGLQMKVKEFIKTFSKAIEEEPEDDKPSEG